ncbi:succinylglutamate desuccinylase/aspartoacylase family protein [Adhaeribacter swui]|uniref:Succinylglutamate desuccinylase/aspartoacylase family protein n=1 Tax=Adhaeribacter swui TaxID=2086471 RepID=A0A7G7G7S1_9BACT|nr:M14-type cytosolic carboxypeptidase [Adhaeribacter swui]QNF33205.1 succinylglutamate desuccinylase/aspartoacylase family protein [Adhaeribacter swui]
MVLPAKIFKKWVILLLFICQGNFLFFSFAGASTLYGSGKRKINPSLNLHPDSVQNSFEFINTNFENASPLNYMVDSTGVVQISLVYDHERSSTNQANSHFHFQVQAKPGSTQTLILQNFDNVWNGRWATPLSEKTNCYVSVDGINWKTIPTEVISNNRLKVKLPMEAKEMYVASVEPYRISDLEKLLAEIKNKPLVQISTIGKTVEGRPLEIIRLGNPTAPYRIFLRARAHGFEAGGNWVVQGLIRSLLKGDQNAARYLKKYCLYIMPMANKDAVARGRSRFNGLGMDLNRKWDKPADAFYSPENYALENWFKTMIKQGKRPHLAIDLHNDNYGNIHISRPAGNLEKYLANMKILEAQLRRHTWFTEGSTGSNFKNPGTLGEGLLERFGIEALVYEFNYDWIASLKKQPFGKDWEALGEKLGEVFYQYFNEANY